MGVLVHVVLDQPSSSPTLSPLPGQLTVGYLLFCALSSHSHLCWAAEASELEEWFWYNEDVKNFRVSLQNLILQSCKNEFHCWEQTPSFEMKLLTCSLSWYTVTPGGKISFNNLCDGSLTLSCSLSWDGLWIFLLFTFAFILPFLLDMTVVFERLTELC